MKRIAGLLAVLALCSCLTACAILQLLVPFESTEPTAESKAIEPTGTLETAPTTEPTTPPEPTQTEPTEPETQPPTTQPTEPPTQPLTQSAQATAPTEADTPIEPVEAKAEFLERIEGVWIDLTTCQKGMGGYSFEFCRYTGGKVYGGVYAGGGWPAMEIVEVLKIGENTYRETTYCPADYDGDYQMSKGYYESTIRFVGNAWYNVDYPYSVWTYICADWEDVQASLEQMLG